jgi:threonine dehydrogenase-like Zn-dependent dehydrogenase
MKALSIVPGTQSIHLADVPEPSIAAPDEVKLRVVRVGICGTDREEVQGGRADAPAGKAELVIGHEMLGQVVEFGSAVKRVQSGDLAVFTVRRGCGQCLPCAMNRPDMCLTGQYRERGIKALDGYETQFVVDKEQYVVRIPRALEKIGVLCEPLSVAEKAIDEAVRLQTARLPDAPASPDWLHERRCLVAGLGPIGLLAALVLRLRGATVYGLDVVDASSTRPQWLNRIGGSYLDGRQVKADQVDDQVGAMDLIFESTGVAALEFNLLDALGPNGLYVLTGIPGGDRPLELDGSELIRQLVLDNQLMVGSVNAARDHYQMAVDDLETSSLLWGDHVEKLITHHFSYTEFQAAFSLNVPEAIKVVIDWSPAG